MACNFSVLCADERTAHTFDGVSNGPVEDGESIIYVVFKDKGEFGKQLTGGDFDTKAIANGSMSVARQALTSISSLYHYVIDPPCRRGDKPGGVVFSTAAILRSITTWHGDPNKKTFIRGVCIVEKRDAGDHKGHAALRLCKDTRDASQSGRNKLKARIAEDLAKKFSVLHGVEAHYLLTAANSPSTGATQDAPALS